MSDDAPDRNPERFAATKEGIEPLGAMSEEDEKAFEEMRIRREAHSKLLRESIKEAEDD